MCAGFRTEGGIQYPGRSVSRKEIPPSPLQIILYETLVCGHDPNLQLAAMQCSLVGRVVRATVTLTSNLSQCSVVMCVFA